MIVFESGKYYINNSIDLVNKSNIIITTLHYNYDGTYSYKTGNESFLVFDINPDVDSSQRKGMFEIYNCFNVSIENLHFSTNYIMDSDNNYNYNATTSTVKNKTSSLVGIYNSDYLVFNNAHFSFTNVSTSGNSTADSNKYVDNSTFALIDIHQTTNVKFSSCKFESNTLTNGILFKSSSTRTNGRVLFVDLNNVVISNNTFYQKGGLMYAFNTGIHVNNSKIIDNVGVFGLERRLQFQFCGIYTMLDDDIIIDQLKLEREFVVELINTNFQENLNIRLGYFATSLVHVYMLHSFCQLHTH